MQIQRDGDGAVFESPDGEVPAGFTRIDAQLTSTPGGLMDDLRGALMGVGQGYKDYVAKPATDFVREGLGMLPFDQGPGTQRALDVGAQALVPQSTTALGIGLGAAASGGLGVIPGIVGAAAGGLIGGAFEGTPMTGAAEGTAAGTVGAGLGYGASVIRRHFGQQAVDEARIGQTLESISPALRGTSAGGLNRQVAEGAQSELSAALEAGLQQIDQAVAGQQFSSRAIAEAFPNAPTTMSFYDAANYIKTLGAGGWTQAGNLAGGMGGSIKRDFRAEAIAEIQAQLPPTFRDMWTRMTSDYGKGRILLDLMREPGVLYPGKAGEAFSGLGVPALQAKAGQYYTEGDLAKRLNPVELRALESGIQRGGTFSEGTDYSRGMFRRFYEGPGAQTFRIPLPTRYVGTPLMVPSAPFTIGAGNLADSIRNPYRR